MNIVKHMSKTDLPSTEWPVSFGLRDALCKVFNYCRQYPVKLQSFKVTLLYVLERIEDCERAQARPVIVEVKTPEAPAVEVAPQPVQPQQVAPAAPVQPQAFVPVQPFAPQPTAAQAQVQAMQQVPPFQPLTL